MNIITCKRKITKLSIFVHKYIVDIVSNNVHLYWTRKILFINYSIEQNYIIRRYVPVIECYIHLISNISMIKIVTTAYI